MKAILVGTGGISRELLRRLGEVWEVTAIDPDPERLELASETRSFERIVGDGSSRVVLRRAGLQGADALVAASNDDETNLEVCRVALESGLSRIAAVAVDPERLPDYRELGVAAISPDGLAARRLELSLETRRVSSTAIAGGKAEVLEFRIAHDSPVRGKALKDLRAHSFVVAALLRDHQVIIPHGDTRLETGDVVTVVGAGADFSEIVKTFTSGEGRFPLDFGKRVAVGLRKTADLERAFAEAVLLVRNSRASSLVVAHPDPETARDETLQTRARDLLAEATRRTEGVEMRLRPLNGRSGDALGSLPAEESVGVLVVPAPLQSGPAAWRPIGRAVDLVRRTGRPVLVSRATAPYRRILVPARRTPAGRAALRAAVDLAMFNQADLVGVAVVDPVFISGDAAPTQAREAIAWLEEEAAVHGVRVEGLIRRGNPVRTLVQAARDADLVVLGVRGARRPFLRPAMEAMIARRTTRSVLLVPVQEHD
jgi:Trk K+ transport system NAD-binding subunit/nucleotide-binding universal stress UspA family protein